MQEEIAADAVLQEFWETVGQEDEALQPAGAQQTALDAELAALRNKTVSAIRRLAAVNPTPEPVKGWCGFGGVSPGSCVLNGTWRLLFTDAADVAVHKRKPMFQEIDAEGGWFVNRVDFVDPDSKLEEGHVFVKGTALSPTEIGLSFQKVRVLRQSRFPKLFGDITIQFPKLLKKFGEIFARFRKKGTGPSPNRRGTGFKLLYVDEDMCIHQTFDGLFFVHVRGAESAQLVRSRGQVDRSSARLLTAATYTPA